MNILRNKNWNQTPGTTMLPLRFVLPLDVTGSPAGNTKLH